MKWKFEKGDILLGNVFIDGELPPIKIFKVFDLTDVFGQGDDLGNQYHMHSISGRDFWVSQKEVELHCIRVNDKEFKRFFELFYSDRENYDRTSENKFMEIQRRGYYTL